MICEESSHVPRNTPSLLHCATPYSFFLLYPFWVYVLTWQSPQHPPRLMWKTPPGVSCLWLPRQPGFPSLASPVQTPLLPPRQEFQHFPWPLPSPNSPRSLVQTVSPEEGAGGAGVWVLRFPQLCTKYSAEGLCGLGGAPIHSEVLLKSISF